MDLAYQYSCLISLTVADLKLTWREKSAWLTTALFACAALMIYSFALDLASGVVVSLLPGVIWTVFLFAGIFSASQSFHADRENGVLDALRISPVHPTIVYLSKTISNFVQLAAIQIPVLLGATVLFNEDIFQINIIMIVLLGTLGYCSLTTLLSALSFGSKSTNLMLPVMALPLLVPLLIACVEATASVLDETPDGAPWMMLLVLFAIWTTLISALMFPLAD
ncbi:MAG: heme exporter protein CcmB [Chloroflexota bacterium]|jgi:heme exporter protein B|nr:heme exporter protein CcmB [Chloroflexota bacterium]